MQITKVNSALSFGRALKPEEVSEYSQTLNEGKKLAGQTGLSSFIMPSTSLPQPQAKNTGVGYLASKEALDYFDYMKTYLGFNVVQDLPEGDFVTLHYGGSSFALGNQNINPELLTTSDYENLLTKEDFEEIVKANNTQTKETIANFHNVSGKDGAQEKALFKAFDRFKALDETSQLKQRYNTFVKENAAWLDFTRKTEPNKEFFKFKQFLATEHLNSARQKLNERGLKLCGDVQINFSKDEVEAFPKAFKKDHYVGVPSWTIPSLDYDTILDETSDSHKLLKQKVQLAAKRYDLLRMDAAWTYVTPVITPKGETKILDHNRKYMADNLLNLIEKWVQEVKGKDYDLKNILYEFDAGVEEFATYYDGKLIPPIKDRVKLYNNTYMSNDWGSNEAFLNRGWPADTFSIGVGNHDSQPLRQIANDIPNSAGYCPKQDSLEPLARILKLDMEVLKNPVDFAKAKFAEPMMAKNNHMFFMDVFGREENFNEHARTYEKNFRYKVPENYQEAYHKSLQEGFGFNIMDSLEKVFKAKGLDSSHPELYSKIVKFKNILTEIPQIIPPKVETTENTEDIVTITQKSAKKGGNKLLWFAGGLVALAGGAFALYKTQQVKTSEKKTA